MSGVYCPCVRLRRPALPVILSRHTRRCMPLRRIPPVALTAIGRISLCGYTEEILPAGGLLPEAICPAAPALRMTAGRLLFCVCWLQTKLFISQLSSVILSSRAARNLLYCACVSVILRVGEARRLIARRLPPAGSLAPASPVCHTEQAYTKVYAAAKNLPRCAHRNRQNLPMRLYGGDSSQCGPLCLGRWSG